MVYDTNSSNFLEENYRSAVMGTMATGQTRVTVVVVLRRLLAFVHQNGGDQYVGSRRLLIKGTIL